MAVLVVVGLVFLAVLASYPTRCPPRRGVRRHAGGTRTSQWYVRAGHIVLVAPRESLARPQLHETGLVGEDGGLDSILELELVENARDVRLDRRLAYDQLLCDLGVR